MKALIACIVFSGCGFAQTATVPEIQTAGGFLDVCGRKDLQASKKSMEAVEKAPTGEVIDTMKKAMDDSVADHALCLAYLAGLVDGWKEGHEHGVLAAHFPAGVPLPRDVSTALKSLSDKEVGAASAAMENDVPCLPEHLTFGELKDTAVKYIRDQLTPNPFLRSVPTFRMVPLALRDAFPCPGGTPLTQPPNARE